MGEERAEEERVEKRTKRGNVGDGEMRCSGGNAAE